MKILDEKNNIYNVNDRSGEGAQGWDSEATESKYKWENPWIEDSLDSSCAINEGLRGELSTKPLI